MKAILVVPRWFPITDKSVRALSLQQDRWAEVCNSTIFPATNNYFTSHAGVKFLKSVLESTDAVLDKTNYYYVKMVEKWKELDGYCQHQLSKGFTMTTNPMAHRVYPQTSQANIDLLMSDSFNKEDLE